MEEKIPVKVRLLDFSEFLANPITYLGTYDILYF